MIIIIIAVSTSSDFWKKISSLYGPDI